MKTPLSIITILVISISSLSAGSRYFSRIIHESDAAMQIELRSDLYIKITDFRQSPTFGLNVIGGVTVFKRDGALSGVNVMTANVNEPNGVIITGPIIVYVQPVPGATLFINYLLAHNR